MNKINYLTAAVIRCVVVI